jgi:hypothetical protein
MPLRRRAELSLKTILEGNSRGCAPRPGSTMGVLIEIYFGAAPPVGLADDSAEDD